MELIKKVDVIVIKWIDFSFFLANINKIRLRIYV